MKFVSVEDVRGGEKNEWYIIVWETVKSTMAFSHLAPLVRIVNCVDVDGTVEWD